MDRKSCRIFLLTLVVSFLMATKSVSAAPNFTLNPSSKSVNNGDEFTVMIGINSGTKSVYSADIWTTFEASLLEVVSVEKVSSPAFNFDLPSKNIDNSAGTMKLSLQNPSLISHGAEPAVGDLLVVTFRAKSTGTANFRFTCTQGAVNDSNIVDADTYNDVIVCSDNASGVYTISNGGGTVNPTSIPAPTSVPDDNDDNVTYEADPTSTPVIVTTSSSDELPRTGVWEITLGILMTSMFAFGASAYLTKK